MEDVEELVVSKERVAFIADGILGAFEHYFSEQRPSVLIHPLADYLVLLYGCPCYVSFYLEPEQQPRSLLSPQDRNFLGILDDWTKPKQLAEHPYVAFDHHRAKFGQVQVIVRSLFPMSAMNGNGRLPLLEDRQTKPLQLLSDWLTNNKCNKSDDRTCSNFVDALAQAVRHYPWTEGAASDSHEQRDSPPALSSAELSDMRERAFNPLRRHLGRLYDDLEGVRAVAVHDAGAGLPRGALNLFCVVRWIQPPNARTVTPPQTHGFSRTPCRYSHTAGILLTMQQRDWVQKIAEQADVSQALGHVSEAWRMIEGQLHTGSRAIADSPLTSGVVDFSLPLERENAFWSRDYPPVDTDAASHEQKDIRRRTLESALYRCIITGPYQILYIPIHVGGVPWLAFYTFREPGNWRSTYHFYRDIIPFLAGSTRTLAQRAYADALADVLLKELRTQLHRGNAAEQMAASLARKWSALACFYPFPRYTLAVPSHTCEPSLTLPDGSQWAIMSAAPAGAFCKQAEIGALDESLVCDTLQRAVAQFIYEQRTLGALQDIGLHIALNMLQLSQAGTLCWDFGSGCPIEDIPVSIIDKHGRARDDLRQRLKTGLNATVAAESRTKAALMWLRLALCPGCVPLRFQATSEYDLKSVVEDANALLRLYSEAMRSSDAQYECKIELDGRALSECLLPRGYLGRDLLVGLVFELLLNAFSYCSEPRFIRITATEKQGQFFLTVTNRTTAARADTRPSSFLRRVKALNELRWIGIRVETEAPATAGACDYVSVVVLSRTLAERSSEPPEWVCPKLKGA